MISSERPPLTSQMWKVSAHILIRPSVCFQITPHLLCFHAVVYVSLYFTYLHTFLKLTLLFILLEYRCFTMLRFFSFFYFKNLLILLAVPGLLRHAGFSAVAVSRSHSPGVVLGLLIAAASLAAKHRL